MTTVSEANTPDILEMLSSSEFPNVVKATCTTML